MKRLAAIFIPLAFLIYLTVPASAWFPHGSGVVSATCPHAAAGYDDGCAGANQSALYIFPNFFTDARQSGQAQYKAAGGASSNHPPPWDVAGVDYPVGQYTADGSLSDPISSPISGCNTNTPTITCSVNSGTIDIKHYRFNGIGLTLNGTGTPTYNIEDVHFTSTAANCRSYTGLGSVNASSSAKILNMTNVTFDFDSTCAINASLYKQPSDPGFTANSNFTGTFTAPGYLTAGSLTVGTGTTGTMRIGSYIDYTGRTTGTTNATAFQLSFLAHWKGTGHSSGTSFTVDSTDASSPNPLPTVGDVVSCPTCGINGVTIASGSAGSYTMASFMGTNASNTPMLSGLSSCVASACDGSVWETTKAFTSSGAVAASTGPVESTANAAVYTLGTFNVSYSANFGWSSFSNAGTSSDSMVFNYNYNQLISRESQHVQVNAKFGKTGGGTTAQVIQDYNTVYWDKYAWPSTATSTISYFATDNSGGASSAVTTLMQMLGNTLIGNYAQNGGTQGSSHIRFLNQLGGSNANINYTLNGTGVATVTAVNSGVINAGDYFNCQGCTTTTKVQPFGTGGTTGTGGTGTYAVSNATDTTSQTNQVVYPSPGMITTVDWRNNYFDPTALGYFASDYGNVPVTTTIKSGNIDMLTGGSAN